jgi:nuclear pore complex protein Nup98-Nup96
MDGSEAIAQPPGPCAADDDKGVFQAIARPDLGDLQIWPDIYSMSPTELRHVRNLTIRKADVGEVTFQCEIDLMRERAVLQDLPSIIRLDPGEVVLYPDPGTKPAEGEGLNRPATITLFQCMPPNNGVFPDADSKARYRERIARMTEQKGARFVDYDCDHGIWQFRVDHF